MRILRILASITGLGILNITPAQSQDSVKSTMPIIPPVQLSSGDTVGGRIYYLKILPGDPGNPDRMPTVPPSDDYIDGPQPEVMTRVEPIYPQSAREQKIEGTVWVKALVDTAGRISNAEVMKSDAEILNNAALVAVRQWTFRPVKIDGESITTSVAVPFRFKLK